MQRLVAIQSMDRRSALGLRRLLQSAVFIGGLLASVDLATASDLPEVGVMLSPKAASSRANSLEKPNRDYNGIPIAGWMLYPNFLSGIVFDDNIYQSSGRRVGAVGVRLRPSFIGELNQGIHQTQLYGEGDVRIYPSHPDANTILGRAGAVHLWEAGRDLVFRFQGDYTRREDMYAQQNLKYSGYTLRGAPQKYNQFTGSASVQKTFGSVFIGLGGSVSRLVYDGSLTTSYWSAFPFVSSYWATTFPSATRSVSRDGTLSSVSGRAGVWISPIIYGFVEAAGNTRRYDYNAWNSDGYRVVAGLGSDRISLFKAEIFGGYQKQFYWNAWQYGNPSSPVLGGKLYWYPSRALTFTASVDETINDNTQLTAVTQLGSSSRTLATALRADYVMSRQLAAWGRFGYSRIAYVNTLATNFYGIGFGPRRDDQWNVGAGLNYEVIRNFNATLEYSYSRLASNAVNASYYRNMLTAGLTYKY